MTAGGTKRQFSKWAELTSDPWILEQITGVTPDLFISPKQYVLPREITWSQSELELINEELAKMIKTGVIRKVNNVDRDQYISNIFFRYKSNKNLRVILNLKRFNNFVNSVHFKMGGLKDALYLMYEGCFFTTVDLKDAYYTVPLHEKATKYFRFQHEGLLYEFTSLVMGYKDSPRIFTKIVVPMLSKLRENNIQILMYIDDALIVLIHF